jgi:hypothetical protein
MLSCSERLGKITGPRFAFSLVFLATPPLLNFKHEQEYKGPQADLQTKLYDQTLQKLHYAQGCVPLYLNFFVHD